MPKRTSVSLGLHFSQLVEKQVGSGRFRSASEVVAAGLQLLEAREKQIERLRAAIIEGEESGPSGPFDVDEFLAEMHKRRVK